MEQGLIVKRLEELKQDIDLLLEELRAPEAVGPGRAIHWGKKVSAEFKAGVLWIEEQIDLDADHLMDCIAFETGGTFDPSIKNMAGSSGLGLIQFMSFTHKALVEKYPHLKRVAATHRDLGTLSSVNQLSFVYYYFRQFGDDFSEYTLEDVYMTILFPQAVGKPLDWEMPWKYGSIAYRQNSGLDLNKDRKITKAEASAGVRRMAALGEQQKG